MLCPKLADLGFYFFFQFGCFIFLVIYYRFFLTSDTTYVRTQLTSAVPSSVAATGVSVGVVINPWDDSYEGDDGNSTGRVCSFT